MNSEQAIAVMRTAAQALKMGDPREIVRTAQALQDALDSVKAEALATIEESRVFELDGASTLSTWVRNELRLSAKDTAALVRASWTLSQLPQVAEAARSGVIRAEHVAVFSYGLKHVGAHTMVQSQPWLLDVAQSCEPNELHRVVRALREAIYPDDLDKAWVDGMDKQDIQVSRVPGGWHVTGFLSTEVGAKFKTVLDSVAKPVDADDDRPGAERRTTGFDQLLDSILEGGMPSDKGVRPHLSIIADAETLQNALDPVTANDGTEPAQLAGYGPIGPKLLTYLACLSDFTPILTQTGFPKKASPVLNVGRSHRLATLKQRRAVIARQRGVCAAPGCRNTHLEIHHTIWWSHGGTTDVDLLIGLCTRCHHLVHRDYLKIKGDAASGFEFTNQHDRRLATYDQPHQAIRRRRTRQPQLSRT